MRWGQKGWEGLFSTPPTSGTDRPRLPPTGRRTGVCVSLGVNFIPHFQLLWGLRLPWEAIPVSDGAFHEGCPLYKCVI